METIVPYLSATRRKAEIWPEIAEACWQGEREAPCESWRPMPKALASRFLPYFTFRNHVPVWPTPSETFGEGLCRVQETAGLLLEEAEKKTRTLLMVSHGFFIRELLNVILARPEPDEFRHDNCGITSLGFRGAWQLNFCNSSHDEFVSSKPAACDGSLPPTTHEVGFEG